MDGPRAEGEPRSGPRRGLILLEPMTVGDILDGAFGLLRATVGMATLVVAVAYVPFEIISWLVTVPLMGDLPVMPTGLGMFDPTAQPQAFDPAAFAPLLAVSAVLGVIGWLVSVLVSGAVTVGVARYEDGSEVEWRDAYRAAWRRFGALMGASLLIVAIGIAGLVVTALVGIALGAAVHPALGIVLGILVLLAFALVMAALSYVTVPVVVLEGRGPATAVGRTWRLLRPRLARTMGIVALALIIVLIVSMIMRLLFGLVAGGVSLAAAPLGWVVQGVGNVGVQLLVIPLVANLALLLYFDARVRSEGLDIEMLTGPPATPPR